MEVDDNIPEKEVVIIDIKRKRIDTEENKEGSEENIFSINNDIINGPKNELEAGPGLQARLGQ